MNVLIVSHLALPHVGGVENLVDLEIRALAEDGHAVSLVTSDGTGSGREPGYPTSVSIHRVPAWHLLERRFGIPYPLFSPRLLPILLSEVRRAEVVHVHGFLFPGSVLAAILAKFLGKPCILTDHGGIQTFSSKPATWLARLGAETLGRLTSLLATHAVTYNSRIRDTLAKFRRRNDVELLFNPVDTNRFFPPSDEERKRARDRLSWNAKPKVLFVGRLIATKGVPLLLSLANPNWDLVFCGPGDQSILGSRRDGVEYQTPRPQEELRSLYHAADVLVLPAEVREGFPLVVQEALACGLPAVLGDDPGFEPYRDLPGLTFTDRTPDDLRMKIEQALKVGRETAPNPFPSMRDWSRQLYREVNDARR